MFKQKLGQVNPINLTLFQEVEREISFRTECGLYYSYYKQMLQAPTLMQGNHNFTRHALYKVCPNKQANEGIWPMEKRLFPLHKGASPQAMNPYKCAHQQKTLVSKPQRCVTALPSILFLSLDRSIPFFIAKFFRDYLIYCLTYCGLTYVSTTLKLLFPKHPKSPSC